MISTAALLSLGIALTSAAFGSLVNYVIQQLDRLARNRERLGVVGEWLSISSSRHPMEDVPDRIDIAVTWRGITLKNKGNPHGFSYEGVAELIDRRYLVGSWRSTRAGATARGGFVFTISPQGDAMSGVFTGHDDQGEYLMGWCLGRDEKSLRRAVEFASRQRIAPLVSVSAKAA
jgi:hypothetical protein